MEKAYREDQWDTAPNSLAPVQHGLITQPEFLAATCIFPANDCGTVEQDDDSLAGGKRGGDTASIVVNAHRSLGNLLLCCGGQRRGLVGAVDHDVLSVQVCLFLLADVDSFFSPPISLEVRDIERSVVCQMTIIAAR